MLVLFVLGTALGVPEVIVEGAEVAVAAVDDGQHALTIRSDRTRLDLEQNKGWFEGKVTAEQGDLRLSADKAEVDLGQNSSIRRAVAVGNVVVSQGTNRASGERALMEGDRVVLTGHPVLETPQHRMAGQEIVFTVGSKTVECSDCTVTLLSADLP